MRTLTISVPVPRNAHIDEQTAKEMLILSLVDSGRLSQSQGAEVLGISRYELIELMGQHGIPVMRYGTGDLERETSHLDELDRIRQRERLSGTTRSGRKCNRPKRASARAPVK